MNYENQQLFKDFEVSVAVQTATTAMLFNLMIPTSLFIQVCDLPVRCARFIARKNWVVTGSDDMQVSKNIAKFLWEKMKWWNHE